jgi:hypothetical protein
MVQLHFIQHSARMLAMQIGNLKSLLNTFIVQLFAHEGMVRVCGLISFTLLFVLVLKIQNELLLGGEILGRQLNELCRRGRVVGYAS